jgi:hypothetical protein
MEMAGNNQQQQNAEARQASGESKEELKKLRG